MGSMGFRHPQALSSDITALGSLRPGALKLLSQHSEEYIYTKAPQTHLLNNTCTNDREVCDS